MSVSVASDQPGVQVVPAGVWRVDPTHSSVEFQVKHMMIAAVKGRFAAFHGALEADEDGGLSAYGTVDVESLDTHEPKRDKHLRSVDFFDVATHPRIEFVSSEITAVRGRSLRIVGALTIKGQTREVELTGELGGVAIDPWGNECVGLLARGEINREDFGLTWNQALDAGGALVANRVKIEVDLSAVKLPGG